MKCLTSDTNLVMSSRGMRTMNRRLSIVVPIFNKEQYLDKCIASLVNQTYKDIEIILVDDGSKDRTKDICLKWVNIYESVAYYYQTNRGVSSARNYGISVANGKYICFVDADDYVECNFAEELIKHMSETVKMCYLGQYVCFNKEREFPSIRIEDGEYKYDDLCKKICDDGTVHGFLLESSCCCCYELEIIQKDNIRFNERVRYHEDGLFNVIYFYMANASVYINYNERLYCYNKNVMSVTSRVDCATYKESIRYILKELDELSKKCCLYGQRSLLELSLAIEFLRLKQSQSGISVSDVQDCLDKNSIRYSVGLLDYKILSNNSKMLANSILRRYFILIKLMFDLKGKRIKKR